MLRLFAASVAIVGWLFASAFIWKASTTPLVYVASTLAVVMGFCAIVLQHTWVRLTAVYLVAATVAVGIAETWFQEQTPEWIVQTKHDIAIETTPDSARIYDADLGVDLLLNQVVHDVETINGELVYDVRYTMGAHGFRIVPGQDAAKAKACVIFFGCSNTFGHGVADDETLPAQLSRLLGDEVFVSNFGILGASFHQSLALLQRGSVEEITGCADKPTHFVLTGFQEHVSRVAGRNAFLMFGPRYDVKGGGVIRNGNFWSPISDYERGRGIIRGLAGRSALVRTLMTQASEQDQARFGAILQTLRDEMKMRFPASRMSLLFWPPTPTLTKILAERDIPYFDLATLQMPEYQPRQLHQFDGHPTAAFNRALAEYLANVMQSSGIVRLTVEKSIRR